MDLSTTYMGLSLKSPIVPSASPLSGDIGNIRKMEDAGAAAVVLQSLFEEQIAFEAEELSYHLEHGTESFAESLDYFPKAEECDFGPSEYLEHIRKIKQAVKIPVIASLNGVSAGGWTDYARKMQDAGADALELNVYFISTDPDWSGEEIVHLYVNALKAVRASVRIPVAMKLSPYFSSLPNTAKRLADAGANGLVLFNRFYQPDFNLDDLEVVPNLVLSSPHSIRLPLRWIAILFGKVDVSFAASTGIYDATDVLKVIMAGADAAMMCGALLKNGIGHIKTVLDGMKAWMDEHEYESVKQMRGILSQKSCPEPAAFERANYMKALKSYA
jgi:dihydroorotate dehydrogenase (fumarate)